MFIGHYASAIAISSFSRERGALTYLALSAVLPDVFMLATGSMNSAQNYHSDRRFLVCLAVAVLIGVLFKFQLKTLALAIAAALVHLPLDIPYMAQDSTNLYAQPWTDFTIEISLLALASTIYVFKQKLSQRRRDYFLAMLVGLVVLQGIWNFVISSSLLR